MKRIGRVVFAVLLIVCGAFAQQNETVTLSPTAYKTVYRFISPSENGYQEGDTYDIGWR